MSKIQINDLNVEQFTALTENEAANIQGGIDNQTTATRLLGVAVVAAVAFPVVSAVAAGAAIAVAGVAIYDAVK